MHRAHTADARPTTIFIHSGAPQALVGSQAGVLGDWLHFPPPPCLKAPVAEGDGARRMLQ